METASETTLMVHMSFSGLTHESRIKRAAMAALEANLCDRVIEVGYRVEGTQKHDIRTNQISVIRLSTMDWLPLPRLVARSLAWLVWTIRSAFVVRSLRPTIIQAHCLAAYPAAVLAKMLTGAGLLYNTHDLETERGGWGWFQRKAARAIEQPLIRFADRVICASGSYARWYRDNYRIALPAMVRNIPDARYLPATEAQGITDDSPTLRGNLGIAKDDLLFFYLGAIGHGRGIPVLLDAFARAPSSSHFCALGYGDFVDKIQDYASRHANIHYHPAVEGEQVLSFIRDADVGLCLIEDIGLSYRLTMPNKLFETRMSGKPVIVSDMPEIAGFVGEYGGGWVVEPSVDAIAALISKIDREEIERVMRDAKPIPTWEDDKAVYLQELTHVRAASRRMQ